MSLNLPKHDELFRQRDVRESITKVPGSVATVTAEADLADSRVLTAGTGITLTDAGAGSTLTIGLTPVTKYYSKSGLAFQPDDETKQYTMHAAGIYSDAGGDFNVWTSIELPHGAVVTSVKVMGSESTKTWAMSRNDMDNSATSMATANINTADTSISNATIDNENYSYSLSATCANNNRIYGVLITYTID